MRIKEMIQSAFGPSADLYTDVLCCNRDATSSELRKAYYRRALEFHPDKQKQRQQQQRQQRSQEHSTQSFQAISAVYEILMDDEKRQIYDKTGQYDDNDDDTSGPVSESKGSKSGSNNQRRWNEFFQSVFREMSHVDDNLKSYRGSKQEFEDVLHYYNICKGDMEKLLTCIVLGKERDKQRWWNDIIKPAIQSGSVPEFSHIVQDHSRNKSASSNKARSNNKNKSKRISSMKRKYPQTQLVDTDDEDDQNDAVRGQIADLEDTDIEDEDHDVKKDCHKLSGRVTRKVCKKGEKNLRKRKLVSSSGPCIDDNTNLMQESKSGTMSKKDKLEFRVARKQKEKKEKELELAKLIQGKKWENGIGQTRKHHHRPMFHQNLIADLENKYSSSSSSKRIKQSKTKTKRPKR